MRLPFTVDEFLSVFQSYNLAIWPMQILAYLAGASAIYMLFAGPRNADRVISAIVSLMWMWNGIVYHIGFFSMINKGAFLFGIVFVVQGLLFFWNGVLRGNLVFGFSRDGYSLTGGLFIFYAMALYPLLGTLAGHSWPHSPAFGVAPCPSTIFTFGLLLLTRGRVPKHLLVIPLLWAVIGLSAAVTLRVYEDYGLFIAGLAGTTLLLVRDRKGPVFLKAQE
ncbi:MAG: hypothetical protein CVU57_12280 [Deltaproteobacteria bacterium HGW-Deltaproteobacteria-15]|jgi:hypothetical protein|nr:MAG: hypothetical protein CVU57_12280 [Deltaproteobacteria bacterium HGW-Deltaproteobacteria-15]